ncbi:MAG: AMIN domain-containing protein, partial [Nitrospirae bacterium]|nr:AMIN domain-containing protein [Nitrospirota bacterium]
MSKRLHRFCILVCAVGVGLGSGAAAAEEQLPVFSTPSADTAHPSLLAKSGPSDEKEARLSEKPAPSGESAPRDLSEPNARATAIRQIRHEQVEGESRVIIETNGAVHPNTFFVDGERLVVDLPETTSTLKKTRMVVTDPYIKRIRVGQHAAPEKKVRVVLDLHRKAAYAVRIEGAQVIVAFAKETPSTPEVGSISMAIGAANPPKADEPVQQEPVKVVKAVATDTAPRSEPITAYEPNPTSESKPAPRVEGLLEAGAMVPSTSSPSGAKQPEPAPTQQAAPTAPPSAVSGSAGAIVPSAEQPVRVASLPEERKSGVRSQESGVKDKAAPVQMAEAKPEVPPTSVGTAEPPAAPAEVKKEEAKPAELPAELLEPPAKPKPAAKKKAVAKKRKPAAAPEPETPITVTAPEIAPSPEAGAGKKISLDFQDADIVNVLRLVAEVGGYNIVVSDEVKGKITVKLLNVPWEQALEVILKTKHLGQIRDGNIIRVAPLTILTKEKEEIQKQKAAAEKAEDLVLKTHPLNFSRAKELEPTLKKQLSPRGELMMDERTNTIVVRDIQSKVDSIIDLAKGLDRPTPQVLIEARVVEIDNKYSKELGVKWGGRFVASPATGNALPFQFPNSLGLSGGIVGTQT